MITTYVNNSLIIMMIIILRTYFQWIKFQNVIPVFKNVIKGNF